jgi:hypothetical protein
MLWLQTAKGRMCAFSGKGNVSAIGQANGESFSEDSHLLDLRTLIAHFERDRSTISWYT